LYVELLSAVKHEAERVLQHPISIAGRFEVA
jgi:hypothetical protein